MKASRLIALLIEEVLSKGDGEVEYEFSYANVMPVHSFTVEEDVDAFGKVTKRTFLLQYS